MSTTATVRGRAARVSAVVLAAAVAAGCGVPSESSPRLVDPTRLPPGLVEPANPTTTAPPAVTVPEAVVRVWMVQDPALVPVARRVPAPTTVDAAVAALLAGTAEQDEPGVRSAWAGPEQVTDVGVIAGIAVVELAEDFLELPAGEQLLAVGQMVLTLTDLPGIGQVQFERDGERIRVPSADGTTLQRPVSRDDYTALAELG